MNTVPIDSIVIGERARKDMGDLAAFAENIKRHGLLHPGSHASGVNGRVIQALGMVFLRYNGAINEADLAKKLAPFNGGAPGLLGKGRSQQEVGGRPMHHCIASIVVDVYNKGRRTGKLDAWES